MQASARTTVNWVLAVATVPAAIAIVVLLYGQILGTAGCSAAACPSLSEAAFTLIQYGVPAIAVLTVVASFFTARKRAGVIVPVLAWALLIIAAIVLFTAFQ
ncbi:hypothetical protein [Mycolicibacterium sp. P9-22]|uniref:hypothetical protein n=1 Tax=Mycolicibacterium sp. P9-22 TaxID=2024613 RepID=UPI0011EE63E3|nr:hypothetical protein [Mycolicibacterium sp. P9-22]KAA0116221.1 hypothetical protein CIW51_15365 [Mycolicibacterium sp. P9-22]